VPCVSDADWRTARLHPHLRKEWNEGKWEDAEVWPWADGRWVVRASRGAVVLGVFRTEGEAISARTKLYLFDRG
jgi:hypothetical protein